MGDAHRRLSSTKPAQYRLGYDPGTSSGRIWQDRLSCSIASSLVRTRRQLSIRRVNPPPSARSGEVAARGMARSRLANISLMLTRLAGE